MHQKTITKATNATTRTSNVLYSVFANHYMHVALQSSVRHNGSWTCPKLMHKFKYTLIIVQIWCDGIFHLKKTRIWVYGIGH